MQDKPNHLRGKTANLSYAARTHKGLKRCDNQDAFVVAADIQATNPFKGFLMAVADGMGGYRAGSVAADVSLKVMTSEYYNLEPEDISKALVQAFERANEAVNTLADDDEDNYLKMGTTMTAVAIKNDRMYFAHIGDSRGYLFNGSDLVQFTEDHSYVANLVRAGAITQQEARHHPSKNIITRAIGMAKQVKVDFSPAPYRLEKGNYILLCSDGLHKVLTESEIVETIRTWITPDLIGKKLVDMTNDRGGPDNITVVLARIEKVGKFKSLVEKVRDVIGKRA